MAPAAPGCGGAEGRADHQRVSDSGWNRGNEKADRTTGKQGDGGNRGHNAHDSERARVGATINRESTKHTKAHEVFLGKDFRVPS